LGRSTDYFQYFSWNINTLRKELNVNETEKTSEEPETDTTTIEEIQSTDNDLQPEDTASESVEASERGVEGGDITPDWIATVVREAVGDAMATRGEEFSNELNLRLQWTVRQLKDFMGDPLEAVYFNRMKGFLNSLIQLYFLMQDFEGKATDVSPEQHAQNYANLQRLLEMALYTQKLNRIHPEVGNTIDLTHHQAVEVIPTDEPGLDNTVAEVIRSGFSFDEKPFLPARVVVYRYSTP
jgi:molecular chaperone GrpE (heat shock protein)